MTRTVKECKKHGNGFLIKVLERERVFWKFYFSKIKIYYANAFGCVYYPSYTNVLDLHEKDFIMLVVDSFSKKNV